MWSGRSPAELIAAAREGDPGAFDELLAPEYPAGFRVAYALLQSVDEAEDAVQEAVIKAWQKFRNLREGSPLRPWFLAIVANHCRALSKTRWRSVIRTDVRVDQPPNPDAESLIDLRRAVSGMAHDDKLVLILRYYLDLPFEEVATTMGVTPKAARRRVEKAIARLRPSLRLEEVLA